MMYVLIGTGLISGRYILTVGGFDASGPRKDIEIYDIAENLRFYHGIPSMSTGRYYHSCLVSKHWESASAGPVQALLCAGGIGDGGKPIDTLEVWYFKKFVTDHQQFPWVTLQAKMLQVSS